MAFFPTGDRVDCTYLLGWTWLFWVNLGLPLDSLGCKKKTGVCFLWVCGDWVFCMGVYIVFWARISPVAELYTPRRCVCIPEGIFRGLKQLKCISDT